MNILLTHGYFIKDDLIEAGIMKPYPPLGLLFLSAWLKKCGIEHEVYDSTFGDFPKLKLYIEDSRPGIVGLYTNLMTKTKILEIMSFIRASQELKNTKIIIGGPDARFNAENYLAAGADIVVPGEGEETLSEIIIKFTNWENGHINLREIKGITFLGNNGEVVQTIARQPLDIKEVLIPNYEKINVQAYLHEWKSFHGYSSMTINSMRGCPYSCNWCSKPIYGNSCRRREPGIVAKEMLMLKNTFQPDQVWFTDDVFSLSKGWLQEFNTEVQKQDAKIPYECITRSDCLDNEVINLLKSSGCRKVWIGAESGSQKVINLMNRKIDLIHTAKMITLLKSKAISVGTFIMLGYPGETKKDILITARFLKETLPDDLTIGIAYPIKGTKYYEMVEPLFDPPFNWNQGNERQILYRKPYSDRFYRFSTRYLKNIVEFKRTEQGLKKWIFFIKAIVSKTCILLLS